LKGFQVYFEKTKHERKISHCKSLAHEINITSASLLFKTFTSLWWLNWRL